MKICNNEIELLGIPSETKYWFVRAGKGAKYYQDFLLNEYIGLDSNKIALNSLRKLSKENQVPSELFDAYKQIFFGHDFEILKARASEEAWSEETYMKVLRSEKRKSRIRAKRILNFVEMMSPGDIVIVPSKSLKKLLIGVIKSDCLEAEASEDIILSDKGYAESNYGLRRKVFWIKELNHAEIPDKLDQAFSARQSLLEQTIYAKEINSLLTSFYRYEGRYYYRMSVNTKEAISSSTWLEYQTLLRDILGEDLDKVYQKQKVQSPGEIILYVKDYWWLIPLIWGVFFGDIDISIPYVNIKVQGIVKYFSKTEREKRKLEVEEKKTNIEAVKSANRQKDAETLEKIKPMRSDIQNLKEDAKGAILNSIIFSMHDSDGTVKKENISNSSVVDHEKVAKLKNKLELSDEDLGTNISSIKEIK